MSKRGGSFRFRILPSVLLTAAILLLPAMLYAWGRQAESFEVRQVRVTGAKRLERREVVRLLRRDYLGANLFTVTRGDVLETLDKLPYLAGVVIDRQFPTTLRVRVIEYDPAAYVLSRDRWYVVSDTGHVIDQLAAREATLTGETGGAAEDEAAAQETLVDGVPPQNAAEASATPVASASPTASASASSVPEASSSTTAVAGGDTTDAASAAASGTDSTDPAAVAAALDRGPGGAKLVLPRIASQERLKTGKAVRDEDLRAALAVLTGLPGTVGRRVRVVDVQPGGQVTLSLDAGLEVEFGDTTRLVAKALALRAVLQAYDRRHVHPTFVDVSIPDRPLGRPRLTS